MEREGLDPGAVEGGLERDARDRVLRGAAGEGGAEEVEGEGVELVLALEHEDGGLVAGARDGGADEKARLLAGNAESEGRGLVADVETGV